MQRPSQRKDPIISVRRPPAYPDVLVAAIAAGTRRQLPASGTEPRTSRPVPVSANPTTKSPGAARGVARVGINPGGSIQVHRALDRHPPIHQPHHRRPRRMVRKRHGHPRGHVHTCTLIHGNPGRDSSRGFMLSVDRLPDSLLRGNAMGSARVVALAALAARVATRRWPPDPGPRTCRRRSSTGMTAEVGKAYRRPTTGSSTPQRARASGLSPSALTRITVKPRVFPSSSTFS